MSQYIRLNEFVKEIVVFCNYEQISIEEILVKFENGDATLKSGKVSNKLIKYMKSSWRNHIQDNFNQYCFHYSIRDRRKSK